MVALASSLDFTPVKARMEKDFKSRTRKHTHARARAQRARAQTSTHTRTHTYTHTHRPRRRMGSNPIDRQEAQQKMVALASSLDFTPVKARMEKDFSLLNEGRFLLKWTEARTVRVSWQPADSASAADECPTPSTCSGTPSTEGLTVPGVKVRKTRALAFSPCVGFALYGSSLFCFRTHLRLECRGSPLTAPAQPMKGAPLQARAPEYRAQKGCLSLG